MSRSIPNRFLNSIQTLANDWRILTCFLSLLFGLSFAATVLTFLRVEQSYDRWSPDGDRIYRLETTLNIPGRAPLKTVSAAGPIKEAAESAIGGVEEVVRLLEQDQIVMIGTQSRTVKVQFSDPNILEFFGIPTFPENAISALNSPNKVLISDQLAADLFGNEDPVGRVLVFRDTRTLEVAGTIGWRSWLRRCCVQAGRPGRRLMPFTWRRT